MSRGLAKRLYGDADPIGRRISNGRRDESTMAEIVGVVDDMHADGLATSRRGAVYAEHAVINLAQTFSCAAGFR